MAYYQVLIDRYGEGGTGDAATMPDETSAEPSFFDRCLDFSRALGDREYELASSGRASLDELEYLHEMRMRLDALTGPGAQEARRRWRPSIAAPTLLSALDSLRAVLPELRRVHPDGFVGGLLSRGMSPAEQPYLWELPVEDPGHPLVIEYQISRGVLLGPSEGAPVRASPPESRGIMRVGDELSIAIDSPRVIELADELGGQEFRVETGGGIGTMMLYFRQGRLTWRLFYSSYVHLPVTHDLEILIDAMTGEYVRSQRRTSSLPE
jgi:hypothetical protein